MCLQRITFVDELEEKAELETQVIASEDFNDDNDVVMAALREEILELQSKVAVKQSSLNATKERCAQLLRQMRAVEDENDQLKELEASWRRRLEVSAQKVRSLRSQAEASEVFAAEHKGKHEALQKQLDSLEEERSRFVSVSFAGVDSLCIYMGPGVTAWSASVQPAGDGSNSRKNSLSLCKQRLGERSTSVRDVSTNTPLVAGAQSQGATSSTPTSGASPSSSHGPVVCNAVAARASNVPAARRVRT